MSDSMKDWVYLILGIACGGIAIQEIEALKKQNAELMMLLPVRMVIKTDGTIEPSDPTL